MRSPNCYQKLTGGLTALLLGGCALGGCSNGPASGEALPTGAYVAYQNGHATLKTCFQRADGTVVSIAMNDIEGFIAGHPHLAVAPVTVQESPQSSGSRTAFGDRQPIGITTLLTQITNGSLRPYPYSTYQAGKVTLPCQTSVPTPPPEFRDNLVVVGYGEGQTQPGTLSVPNEGNWQAYDSNYPERTDFALIPN